METRTLLAIPAVAVLPAVAAALAGRLSGGQDVLHVHEAVAAAVVCGVTTLAAALVVRRVRQMPALVVVQVTLAATVGQMVATAGVAMAVWLLHLVGSFQAFALWLLAYYWIELVPLVLVCIRTIRGAKPAGGGEGNASAAPAH